MPEIAITAAPAAQTGAAATGSGSEAAAGPFALLLQQQMDGTLAGGLPPGLIQALAAATDGEAAAGDGANAGAGPLGLESLLPALLGARLAASSGTDVAASAESEELAAATTADVLLALPLVPAMPVVPAEPAAIDAEGGPALAAIPAAGAAAILAAKPEAAAALAEEGAPAPGFSALLAGTQGAETAQQLAAAHAATTPPAAATRPATEPAPIQVPMGADGWDRQVGDRLVWMAGRNEGRAELVLTPPQLGRIEVSLSVSGDQTNALFVSANPAVREALESALPRLREMLADAGITLGQAQVGSESPGQSAGQRENGDNRPQAPAGSDAGTLPAQPSRGARAWVAGGGRGLVDVFA